MGHLDVAWPHECGFLLENHERKRRKGTLMISPFPMHVDKG